jgi:ABC-2 type transport system permease protein
MPWRTLRLFWSTAHVKPAKARWCSPQNWGNKAAKISPSMTPVPNSDSRRLRCDQHVHNWPFKAPGIRTLSQAIVVYALSLLLGVKLNWSPLALLNVIVVVVPASTLFSTFSLVSTCIVKMRERFMGVGRVLTMPLFFASNAIYPTTIMPPCLKIISHLNPLTYVVDALRTSMLADGASSFGLGLDYAVMLLNTIILVFIGARLYLQLGV